MSNAEHNDQNEIIKCPIKRGHCCEFTWYLERLYDQVFFFPLTGKSIRVFWFHLKRKLIVAYVQFDKVMEDQHSIGYLDKMKTKWTQFVSTANCASLLHKENTSYIKKAFEIDVRNVRVRDWLVV